MVWEGSIHCPTTALPKTQFPPPPLLLHRTIPFSLPSLFLRSLTSLSIRGLPFRSKSETCYVSLFLRSCSLAGSLLAAWGIFSTSSAKQISRMCWYVYEYFCMCVCAWMGPCVTAPLLYQRLQINSVKAKTRATKHAAKLISFKVHGIGKSLDSLASPDIPQVFGFSKRVQNGHVRFKCQNLRGFVCTRGSFFV